MSSIFLDHNSTTPLRPGVWDAMRPAFTDSFGNPASSHSVGKKARQLLEKARDQIRSLLDARPDDEVVFTSGATEANNLALFGLSSVGPVYSAAIEHPCVVEPVKQLGNKGIPVVTLPVDSHGFLEIPAVNELPSFVSVMLANHETGAIQPVGLLRKAFPRAILHTDAAQAVGKIPVSFRELGVQAMTVSAHKFGGPKGIGALILKKGTSLKPLLFGGHQQQGFRPGTEPVSLAVGMAAALKEATSDLTASRTRMQSLGQRFLSRLQSVPEIVVHRGPSDDHNWLANTWNISFIGCRAELLLMSLDLAGVSCSTGSACSSGSLLPSPVLQAMGVSDPILRSAMRFSLGHTTTEAEIDEAAERIATCVQQIRR